MTFDVLLTSGAEADLVSIFAWISERSPAGAEKWYRRWQETLQAIKDRADRFGLAPESELHSAEIRQAIFKTRRGLPYRALFVIREHDVYLIHLRGPGEDTLRANEIRIPE